MSGLNKVLLIGNLGQDPELRYTQGGGAVLNMRLATNESWKDASGERKERTEWHSVVLFGKRADALSRILQKGSQLCVEGRLQTRSWEDKQGQKRWTTEIVALDVILLGSRRGGDERVDDRADEPSSSGNYEQDASDDIPF